MTALASMSFITVRRRFDFRSIEVGRWVTPHERDRAAGRFYWALTDLLVILKGPEALVSLRGSLGLQYGIGGRPGVAAHSTQKRPKPGSIQWADTGRTLMPLLNDILRALAGPSFGSNPLRSLAK